MNLSTTNLPEWSSDDAYDLKKFLTSDLAVKAFAFVSDACPPLLDGADVNKTLVRSGEVKGFAIALDTLFSLTHHKPEEAKTPVTYPDLDDEAAWKEPIPTPTK